MIHFLLTLILSMTPGRYQVIKVHGEAIVKGQKIPLQSGQYINDADSIRFLKPGSYVIVISAEKGRMTITENNDARTKTAENELYQCVAGALRLSKTHIIMAGRNAIINSENEFANWLIAMAPKDTALLIVDTMQIPLGNYFEIHNKDCFFLLSYTYKGETINKRLSTYRQGKDNFFLMLDKSIFTIDGKQTGLTSASNFKWFYYDTKTGYAQLLGLTSIMVINSGKLKPELCLLKKQLQNKSSTGSNEVFSQIYSYLKDVYGATNADTIYKLGAQQCE